MFGFFVAVVVVFVVLLFYARAPRSWLKYDAQDSGMSFTMCHRHAERRGQQDTDKFSAANTCNSCVK